MKSFAKLFFATLILQTATAGAAVADDWRIARLSGAALVFYHGRWTPLRLGDIVADDAFVRTMADGELQFARDRETIDVEPNTQIQILDRKDKRFTTVRQYFGAVGIEATHESVPHFSVRTPMLAAVVKGTIFAVATNAQGSTVVVARGRVGVRSLRGAAHGDVRAGQTASVGPNGALSFGAGGAAGASASAAAAAAAAAAASSSSSSSSSSSASSSSSSSSSAAAGASGAAGSSGTAAGVSAAAAGAAPGSANGSGQGNSGHGNSGQGNSGQGGQGGQGGHGGQSGSGGQGGPGGPGGQSGHGGQGGDAGQGGNGGPGGHGGSNGGGPGGPGGGPGSR